MKTRSMLTLLAIAATASLLVTPQADERREPPAWVKRILEAQFPHAEMLEFDRENGDDYDVKLRRKDDQRRIQVEMDQDAGITEIDEDLIPEHLPERIVRSLNRTFPNADIRKGVKATDIRVSYRVYITSDGRKREVRLSPHGRILEIEKGD